MFSFVKNNDERAIIKASATRIDYFIMDKPAQHSPFARWQQSGKSMTTPQYPNVYFHTVDSHKMPDCNCLHPASNYVTLQAQSSVLQQLQSRSTYHLFVRRLLQAQEFDAQFAKIENRDYRKKLHAWLNESVTSKEQELFAPENRTKDGFLRVLRELYMQLIVIDLVARMLRYPVGLLVLWWPSTWEENVIRKELIERFQLKENF